MEKSYLISYRFACSSHLQIFLIFFLQREQHLKHRRTKSVVSPSFISKKTTSSSTSSSEGKRSQKDFLQNGPVYPLWRNERTNLCWLDATLSLLVTNKNINTVFDAAPEDSVIKVFLAQYNKCMEIFNKDKDYANVQETLASIRQDVWNFLQPKLTLTAGQFDSPLFTLPLLLKEDARLREMTILKYSHSFQCEHCGFEKQTKLVELFAFILLCFSQHYLGHV